MLGMHPFDEHMMMYNTPRRHHDALRKPAQHARRPSPQVDTSQDKDAFYITLRAPQGFKLNEPSASRRGATGLKIEGILSDSNTSSSIRDYITRARTGIYAEPSTRSPLIGVVPAGRILQGSAPSSRGWIALVDGEEEEDAYMHYDSLAPTGPEPQSAVPFSEQIDLPADADVERGTSTPNADGSLTITLPKKISRRTAVAPRPTSTFQVVHIPHVYVRAKPHLRSPALAVKRAGETVRVSDEVDGWLKLAGEDGWMLRDGSALGLGTLLARVEEPKVAKPKQQATTRNIPVHVSTAARAATTTGAPTYNKAARPAPSSSTIETPEAAKAPARTRKAATARAGVDALRGSGEPALLSECSASAANVQSPQEATEHWVAIDDGSFVPLAIA